MFYSQCLNQYLKVYAITDRKYIFNNCYTFEQAVEDAIIGGATIIQIREKQLDYNTFLEEAINIKKITTKYNIPLIINDNIEVAINSDADGVHLGQEDLYFYGNDFKKIRAKFNNKILGISANSVEEAIFAKKNGADYLGINTPFVKTKYSNNTKQDALQVSFDTMKSIIKAVNIPCVAIGGIHKKTIPLLNNLGLSGFAMISEIFDNKDIKSSTTNVKNIIDKVKFD